MKRELQVFMVYNRVLDMWGIRKSFLNLNGKRVMGSQYRMHLWPDSEEYRSFAKKWRAKNRFNFITIE